MKLFYLLVTIYLVFQTNVKSYGYPLTDSSDLLTNFIFASCNKEDKPQPLWPIIDQLNPQFYLWAGDNIYVNAKNLDLMKRKYQKQWSQPGYKKIREKYPVIGMWDDHDYGDNNEDRHWPLKEQSRIEILKFLEEPLESPRWTRSGIYTSYDFGPINSQVKLILLDTRFNKTGSREEPDDILGQEQWEWLEDQLKNSQAKVHFILSSFSLLSPKLVGGEQWLSYKGSWERFNRLVKQYDPKGLMILTGDRHFGGLMKRSFSNKKEYFELMSSGLTHVTKAILRGPLRSVYGEENTLFELNFAQISLDWDSNSGDPTTLKFGLHTTEGRTRPSLQRIWNWENGDWKPQFNIKSMPQDENIEILVPGLKH